MYKRNDVDWKVESKPPDSLLKEVENKNAQMLEETDNYNDIASVEKDSIKANKAQFEELKDVSFSFLFISLLMSFFSQSMAVSPSDLEGYAWVATSWLKKWMSEKKDVGPIDNAELLCAHKKVSPLSVRKMKRIKVQVYDILAEKYGGGPKLTHFENCEECLIAAIDKYIEKTNWRKTWGDIKRQVDHSHYQTDTDYFVSKQFLRGILFPLHSLFI